MTDEPQAPEPGIRLMIESVDAETIGEATRLRLVVEGEPETISVLSSVVLQLLGGDVERAVTVGPDGEQDVTADFAPRYAEIIDILDTGDDSVEG